MLRKQEKRQRQPTTNDKGPRMHELDSLQADPPSLPRLPGTNMDQMQLPGLGCL
jgi:hypothetical protein